MADLANLLHPTLDGLRANLRAYLFEYMVGCGKVPGTAGASPGAASGHDRKLPAETVRGGALPTCDRTARGPRTRVCGGMARRRWRVLRPRSGWIIGTRTRCALGSWPNAALKVSASKTRRCVLGPVVAVAATVEAAASTAQRGEVHARRVHRRGSTGGCRRSGACAPPRSCRAEGVHLLGGVLQGDDQVSRRLRQAGACLVGGSGVRPSGQANHRYFLGESLQRAALRAVEATIARDPEVTSQHLVLALLQQPAVVAAVEGSRDQYRAGPRACL